MADFVELHARSAFSFLRGASDPEALADAAAAAGLGGVALLDRDGVYGAPRLHQAARARGFRALVGAEVTLADGSALPLLALSREGYRNLCGLLTEAKLTPRAGTASDRPADLAAPDERKRPCYATWEEVGRFSAGLAALTGDEDGPVLRAWAAGGAAAAAAALAPLRRVFGPDRLHVELQRHRRRGEERELAMLRDLAAAHGLPTVATGGVAYAARPDREVADVFTCLRHHTTLDAAGRRLAVNDQRHVRSPAEMRALFADDPGALDRTAALAERAAFTLADLGYAFPSFPVPDGRTMDDFLHEVAFAAARRRYRDLPPGLRAQLEKELALIAELGFAGYFLIVWDICRWAREEHGILVQGRGSAANSAVCYVLGITAVDPLRHRLLFERFLSRGRVGSDGRPSWPDIDLDFPSGERREAVIQEVYRRYGRLGAAMTANVITYRGRSTVREVGKVLGFGEDALDRFSRLYSGGDFPQTLELRQQLEMAGIPADHPRAAALARVCARVRGLPRHLGQHSGGMVIAQGRLSDVVPLEPATMPGRTVCQWDKDDCEDLGIVKIDFLGLGMMAVLQDTLELCAARGGPRSFDEIPKDDAHVFERIRAADTVGVFQIESRAQMATLPRFLPRNLYDLAMQVALVRPGPITGQLVHPLIRRRAGLEPPDYIDPSVEERVKPVLERTLGVILFQEQMLELSMTLAGFSGGEAEELRRAMGFTKDPRRLERALEKLTAALRRAGHNERVVRRITESAVSFAAYGFPESHAIGFGLLAYLSTWLKFRRPAEFLASLLNNQPMGFYGPATLVQDARRGVAGVRTRPVCVARSDWNCTVEDERTVRLGLRLVKGLRAEAARGLVAARTEAPFASLDDLQRRTRLAPAERRALARLGALNTLAGHRRAALWRIEGGWTAEEALLRDAEAADAETPAPLAPMDRRERLAEDFAGTGVTVGVHPMALVRPDLPDVVRAADLARLPDGARVVVAGAVICRQRPGTASGVVFVSLEDETGIANAVLAPEFFERHRLVVTTEPALRLAGPVQNVAGVVHVRADRVEALRHPALPAQASHDFH